MRFKEFKNAVEDWGMIYDYKPVINIYLKSIEIVLKDEGYTDVICEIHKLKSSIIDLNWDSYRELPENARGELFKIVTEFTATPIEERQFAVEFEKEEE